MVCEHCTQRSCSLKFGASFIFTSDASRKFHIVKVGRENFFYALQCGDNNFIVDGFEREQSMCFTSDYVCVVPVEPVSGAILEASQSQEPHVHPTDPLHPHQLQQIPHR